MPAANLYTSKFVSSVRKMASARVDQLTSDAPNINSGCGPQYIYTEQSAPVLPMMEQVEA